MSIVQVSINKLLGVCKWSIETSLDDIDVVLNSLVVDKLVLSRLAGSRGSRVHTCSCTLIGTFVAPMSSAADAKERLDKLRRHCDDCK